MKDMKFELNRLTDYSDEELIREIQRVAELLNIQPLTGAAFEKESKVARTTINRRFGGWRQALEAAGLEHLYSGQVITQNMRKQKNRGITDEELLEELRKVSKAVNRKDISTGDFKQNSSVGYNVYHRRFGTWEKAVELAGLKTRVPGVARRKYENEDLFENLYEVWVHYGRQPHYSEMNNPPSKIKSKNYTNRFETWRKALIAFIDYMDEDISFDEKEQIEKPHIQKLVTSEKTQQESPKKDAKDSRNIPLGLRFKVLYRDDFKCVLCGNNPPASPGLVLHVDHIVPWSKGGKTVIDNLRTLCAACNIGRGNRYAD